MLNAGTVVENANLANFLSALNGLSDFYGNGAEMQVASMPLAFVASDADDPAHLGFEIDPDNDARLGSQDRASLGSDVVYAAVAIGSDKPVDSDLGVKTRDCQRFCAAAGEPQQRETQHPEPMPRELAEAPGRCKAAQNCTRSGKTQN